ncbi:circadian clock-controlled protein daywake [Drosophila eugracilis]|uniref:circadian clock-controlled protein daywake n=1 Tax=Drosophila eugracilis TaxID=29029 RepID=UPI0007E7DBA1|nr:circadian clock-controlled protein daywake [Drosophila eugracilis]
MQSSGVSVFFVWMALWCLVPCSIEASDGFPSPLKRCKVEDESCLVAQAQTFFKAFKKGIPERQVTGLEPIDLGTMRVDSGGHSESLQFKLIMSNAKLYNLANSVVVKSLKGFTKDLTKPLKLTMVMDAPELEVRAKYDVDGKLLILPIVSKGDVTIRMTEVLTKCRIMAEPVKRSDGHAYLNITDYKTVTKIQGGHFNMSNLFNDNVELRESTLKVLNQEWNTLAVDVQPKINEACSKAFRSILQNLWNNIPYDEFFEDE